MSERIIMRTGEALVAGGPPGTAAEPEVIIGELDGPVGTDRRTSPRPYPRICHFEYGYPSKTCDVDGQ
jgi:hypothetical protein